jgi:glucan 1,3-beta-glucosidase
MQLFVRVQLMSASPERFVQESWMVPSLFKCAGGSKLSEIDIVAGWGGVQNAKMLLEKHWDTFITEGDFKYLKAIGINSVRIPIGYWSLGPCYCEGTPFAPFSDVYANSWPRVLRAISWAEQYDIGVLVDLHGAYGSQNGEHFTRCST